MASIHDDLRAFLLTLSAVTDVVGSTKVRPDVAEQDDEPPYIVIQTRRIDHANSLDGLGGLAKATIEIHCVSLSAVERWEMVEDVRINDTNPGTGLAGYSGTAGTREIEAHLTDTVSGFNPATDGSEKDVYYCVSTYIVEYAEAT